MYKMQDPKNYGQALDIITAGGKAARKGWNGKGMYIFLFSQSNFCTLFENGADFHIDDEANSPQESIDHIGFYDYGKEKFYPMGDFILLKTAGNKCIPWVTSQEDALAEDWEEVFEGESD